MAGKAKEALRGPGLTELLDKGPESGRLLGALAGGRLGGTLLFHGPDGAGKSSLAFYLAAALNCRESGGRGAPCGVCDSCRKVERLAHPDVIWIPPVPGSFYKNGRLDEERLAEVYEQRRQAPWLDLRFPEKSEHHLGAVARVRAEAEKSCYEGRNKVFIMTGAEKLRLEAANALLKLLEEPRAGVWLILCTERPSGLLPTILSRCQRLRVRRPGRAAALGVLCGRFGQEESTAAELLALADSNLSLAFRLLDQESLDRQREWIGAVFEAVLARGMEPSFSLLEDRSGPFYNRGDFERFAAGLTQGLRDALVMRLGGPQPAAANRALCDFSERTVDAASLTGLLGRMAGLGDDLGRNVNLRLLGWSIIADMRKAVGIEHGDD
ncbi:hypothetical protein LLH00_05680 [bacterium]|nr:hypothetical protein [bacterium]